MCRVFRSGGRAAIVPSASAVLRTGFFFRSRITSIRKSQDRAHSSERFGSVLQHRQRRRIMNKKPKFVLAVVAGVALGAAAMQGLHAQAKLKAYSVSELEIIDVKAQEAYLPG